MVVLPAPDGAENMMSLPSMAIGSLVHLLISSLVQLSISVKTNERMNR
jgi:hypothetical protein